MSSYTVGVIGLGKIAAMYGKPEDALPYCHVGGIRHSDRVKLAAVADLSAEAREAFRDVWGSAFSESLAWHDDLSAMLTQQKPDIVAVCVRGPHHFEVMMQVIEAGVKAIFLEKPPTCSLEELDAMMSAIRSSTLSAISRLMPGNPVAWL